LRGARASTWGRPSRWSASGSPTQTTGAPAELHYYLLENGFTVLLVNAAHIKHVPGRRTDTIDAARTTQLLAHGLLTASFVPPPTGARAT